MDQAGWAVALGEKLIQRAQPLLGLSSGNLLQAERFMKKDSAIHAAVRKESAKTAPVREPRASNHAPSQFRLDAEPAAAPPGTISVSARYIDSRLKQFCLR